MNHSLLMADRPTHLKIVFVGLLLATLVVWGGIGIRVASDRAATAPAVSTTQAPSR